jgi:hypothetical protein
MRIGLTLMAVLLLVTGFGCVSASALSSCISQANATAAAALERYKANDLGGEAKLRYRAATTLEQCLASHPNERTITAEQRAGEMWMYSGEVEHEIGNVQMARAFLSRAKEAFSRLRRDGHLHGTALDEVLLDAHEVDRDLSKL